MPELKEKPERFAPNWKAMIEAAMMSDCYRKFRKMFKVQCTNCGSDYCVVEIYTPVVVLQRNGKKEKIWLFNKTRVGFMCLKCQTRWTHAYDLEERVKEIEKYELDPNSKLVIRAEKPDKKGEHNA